MEWTVVDSEGLQKLTQVSSIGIEFPNLTNAPTQILIEQQNGIAHLTKIVQGHQRDLDVILGKAPSERPADPFSSPKTSQMLLGASMHSPNS